MINRTYFIATEYHNGSAGVNHSWRLAKYRSWFPDPVYAVNDMQKMISKNLGVEHTKLVVTNFGRV